MSFLLAGANGIDAAVGRALSLLRDCKLVPIFSMLESRLSKRCAVFSASCLISSRSCRAELRVDAAIELFTLNTKLLNGSPSGQKAVAGSN